MALHIGDKIPGEPGTDQKLVEAFGVGQEKSMMGKKIMATVRTTFLVGECGAPEHDRRGRTYQ